MTEKRKKIEDLVYSVMSAMDPTGTNTAKYKKMFQTMSDKEFTVWIEKFLADDKSNFRFDIEEFGDPNRVLKYENIEKAAKILKINLMEYVYLPHLSSNPNRPIRTKQPVIVGYLNIKRTQQLATKKTGLSLSDMDRDDMTGATRGESKGGTSTGVENEFLAGVGGDELLSEFCGARADNTAEYDKMLSQISETGSVRLEDIKTSVYDKPTLLQADIWLMAMGLKTDLVSESYYSIDRIKAALD